MGRVGAGNSFQESFIFSVLHIIMESPVIPRKYFYFCGKETIYTCSLLPAGKQSGVRSSH